MPAPPVTVAAGLGYGLHEGGGKRLRSSGDSNPSDHLCYHFLEKTK